MDFLSLVTELFTNADHFLVTLATEYGWLVYAAMFLIFFLETGIVVMAFLPGDSLLFVAGTVAAAGTMSPWGLMLAVILGACLGNTLGFHTGRWLGNRIYDGSIRWIDAKKLQKTQVFYEKHGGKTIVLARFVPIVRAFAPLVAGAAKMSIGRFELYSGLGAVIWAVGLIGLGYLFGNIPIVKNNLSMILLLGVISAASGPVIVALAWKYLHTLKIFQLKRALRSKKARTAKNGSALFLYPSSIASPTATSLPARFSKRSRRSGTASVFFTSPGISSTTRPACIMMRRFPKRSASRILCVIMRVVRLC